MCSNQRPVKKPATKTHPHQNQQPPVLALGPVWQKSCCAPYGQWKGLPCTPCFLLTQHTGSRSCKAGQEQASVASSRVLSGARAWETCPGNSAGPSAQTVQDSMHLGKCCIHLSGTSCLGKSWWEIHGDFTVQDLFTRTHHSHGQELPRTQSRWFPTLELQTQTFQDYGHCVSQPLVSLCLSPISTPLLCRILSFYVELADSASPRSSLEPALKAPEGRKFQSSSSVLSLKRESELGVQKRESEMNPRSIFSLALQPLTKLCQKVMGCFLQGA